MGYSSYARRECDFILGEHDINLSTHSAVLVATHTPLWLWKMNPTLQIVCCRNYKFRTVRRIRTHDTLNAIQNSHTDLDLKHLVPFITQGSENINKMSMTKTLPCILSWQSAIPVETHTPCASCTGKRLIFV